MTPRGDAVDPDVYCRNARSSGAIDTFAPIVRAVVGDRVRREPWESTRAPAPRAVIRAAALDDVGVSRERSRRRRRRRCSTSRGSVREACDGCGGYAGTATTPAYRQPKNARDEIESGRIQQQRAIARAARHARAAPTRRARARVQLGEGASRSLVSPSTRKVKATSLALLRRARAKQIDERLVRRAHASASAERASPTRSSATRAGGRSSASSRGRERTASRTASRFRSRSASTQRDVSIGGRK